MEIQGIDTGDQTAVEGRHEYFITLRKGDWCCLENFAISTSELRFRTADLILLQRIRQTNKDEQPCKRRSLQRNSSAIVNWKIYCYFDGDRADDKRG